MPAAWTWTFSSRQPLAFTPIEPTTAVEAGLPVRPLTRVIHEG
jgi:hypothetical protein